MKIPNKVKVAGHWYEVNYPYIFKERTDVNGRTSHSLCRIHMTNLTNSGEVRPESEVLVTFIHEILHAINYRYGEMIFDKEKEEDQVSALSEGILQVLVDNEFIELEKSNE